MHDTLVRCLAVAVGGAIGAVARHLVGSWAWGRFPLGTFLANVTGCLLIGLLLELRIVRDSPVQQAFLVTGLLGGLTTFSAFAHQSVTLHSDRQFVTAGLYLLASVAAGLAAVWLGMRLAR